MTLKNILLASLLVLATGASAQNSNSKMPYGAHKTNMIAERWNNYDRHQYFSVRFGLNVSQLYYHGMESSYTSLVGMNFGLYSGWQLGKEVPIFFETGLEYEGKGAKSYPQVPTEAAVTPIASGGSQTIYSGYESCTVSSRQHYLEIPFVFKYKIHTGVHGLTVQPLFGGFMGFGVGGSTKYYLSEKQATAIGLTRETDEYFPRAKTSSFRNGGYRAFDAGLRVGCGLAYTNFYFEMRYDIGLYNIASNGFKDDSLNRFYNYDGFDNSIKSGCFSMSVGIEF